MRPSGPSGSVLLFLLALALAACDDGGPIDTACEPRDDYAQNDTVCCETYEVGSDGGYCCYDFTWTYAYDCPVFDDLELGGRQIVVDECCE